MLHYLDHYEKDAVARNIGTLLKRHPEGVWYTDMPLWEGITDRDSPMARTTSKQTGRNVPANRFEDRAEVYEFFNAHGLEVRRQHSYIDPALISSLTSPANVDVSQEDVIATNTPWSMYAIGLSKQA